MIAGAGRHRLRLLALDPALVRAADAGGLRHVHAGRHLQHDPADHRGRREAQPRDDRTTRCSSSGARPSATTSAAGSPTTSARRMTFVVGGAICLASGSRASTLQFDTFRSHLRKAYVRAWYHPLARRHAGHQAMKTLAGQDPLHHRRLARHRPRDRAARGARRRQRRDRREDRRAASEARRAPSTASRRKSRRPAARRSPSSSTCATRRRSRRPSTATAKKFGGLDILVNNASAISLTPTLATPAKRFDLMIGGERARHVPLLAGGDPAPAESRRTRTSSRSRRRSTCTRSGSRGTWPTPCRSTA